MSRENGPQDFYATFDDKCTSRTNGKGKVYAQHLSLLLDVGKKERKPGEKTASEIWKDIHDKQDSEREEWKKVLENEIVPHYRSLAAEDFPKADSFKSLLELRVIPPILKKLSKASRSSTAKESRERRYPPAIHAWSDFKEKVQNYALPEVVGGLDRRKSGHEHFFFLCGLATIIPQACEAEEQSFLLNVLNSILFDTNARPEIVRSSSGLMGQPDFHMKKGEEEDGEEPVLVGEMKSTQNLFLPELSSDVVSQYNQGYKDVWGSGPVDRRVEFSNVCHPLAQLFEYMISNNCRNGILSCATRSYFCFVNGDGSDDKPYMCWVSDAFFVGEPNYIKAWVYMYDMGKKFKSSTELLPDWSKSNARERSPGAESSKKRPRDGNNKHHDRQDDEPSSGAGGSGDRKSGAGRNVKQLPTSGLTLPLPADGDGLPYVAEANIEFMESIGHGFHGTAFRVRVNGAEAALKQFDANKGGIAPFLKEVSAYARLKSVWGELVPELLFVSESWLGNILYLGLQLGTSPETVDYDEWQGVLSLLEEKYGVVHNDADDTHNTVLIPDKDSPGRERLAIIDFEDCELVKPTSPPRHTPSFSSCKIIE